MIPKTRENVISTSYPFRKKFGAALSMQMVCLYFTVYAPKIAQFTCYHLKTLLLLEL